MTFDPKKSADNVLIEGRETLPFTEAERFDFGTALTRRDTRNHPKTGKLLPRTALPEHRKGRAANRDARSHPDLGRIPGDLAAASGQAGARAMARQPVIYDDDAPEHTDAELGEFRPAREVSSAEEFAAASSVRRGRPKKANPKVPVTLRLDPAVYAALKSTGKGWHTRAGAVLAASVGIGEPEPPAKTRATQSRRRRTSKTTVGPSSKTVA